MNEPQKLSIVFPYYYGPRIREYGAALLWFDRLDCISMPWISPYPVSAFNKVAARAHERQLPLAELFDLTGNWLNESYLAIATESKELELLDNRVTRLGGVAPGGQLPYKKIREELDSTVEIAFTLLDDPELLRVAGCQLIWRCYEYYLEMSNSQDAVLDALLREETVKEGKSRLLAECLVNHYSSFAPTVASIVVDNRATVDILAKLGQKAIDEVDYSSLAESSTFQRDHLASTIFENTLSSLCPPITSKTCGLYHRILNEKADTIKAAKRKCYLAADNALENRNKPASFKTLMDQTLSDLQSEVQEVIEIDKASWRKFVGQLSEDRVVWAGAVGFLGSLTGDLPPVTLAAAAVTLFTSVAAKGIAEIRSKAKTLKGSDWCFIYELNRNRIPFDTTQMK